MAPGSFLVQETAVIRYAEFHRRNLSPAQSQNVKSQPTKVDLLQGNDRVIAYTGRKLIKVLASQKS